MVVDILSPNVYTLASQDGRLAGRYHGSHLQRFIDDDDGEDVDPNDPEEIKRQAQLDKKLLEIHDSDSEADSHRDSIPETNINFGYGDTADQQEIELEPARRMQLRHRSYSC